MGGKEKEIGKKEGDKMTSLTYFLFHKERGSKEEMDKERVSEEKRGRKRGEGEGISGRGSRGGGGEEGEEEQEEEEESEGRRGNLAESIVALLGIPEAKGCDVILK